MTNKNNVLFRKLTHWAAHCRASVNVHELQIKVGQDNYILHKYLDF